MKCIGYCTARYWVVPQRLTVLSFAALLLGATAQCFAPPALAQGAGAPTGPAAVAPLSPRETRELLGFDTTFKAADSEGKGRLTLAQFKKA